MTATEQELRDLQDRIDASYDSRLDADDGGIDSIMNMIRGIAVAALLTLAVTGAIVGYVYLAGCAVEAAVPMEVGNAR